MKKKILYITPYLPFPNNKAANLFISKRIEILSRKYEIDLISITNGRYDTNINKYKISKYISNFYFIKRDKVSIKAIFKALFLKEPLFNILSEKLINIMKDKILDNRYSFIIIEHSYLSAMIVKLVPEIASKVVTVFHNIETHYFYDLYKKTNWSNLKKYYYYIEYKGCKKFEEDLLKANTKASWFLSKRDLEFVKKLSRNNNLLFSPTISFNLKKIRLGEKKYDLLYLGQLDNQRNLHGLTWFIKNVWKFLENKDLMFAIAGRGNLSKIKHITKNFKNINVIGEVENLGEIYSKSKIVVIPIFNTIGVQTKLFDALSYGSIVICTKDAIKGTIFEDNKHLIIAQDSEDFKEKILSILNNKSKFEYLRKRIYDNLKEIENFFDEEKLLKDMERSLYEK